MNKGTTLFLCLRSARFWRVLTFVLLCTLALDLFGKQPVRRFRGDQILVEPKNATAAEKLAKIHGAKKHKIARNYPHLNGVQVLRLAPGADPLNEVDSYKASGLVAHAEPDYFYQASVLPNDPAVTNGTLWAMKNIGQNNGKTDADIDAVEAWNFITSAEEIVVAVIDTGVRVTHEDLAPNIWRNPNESANGRDDDGNGIIDDIHGLNAVNDSGNPSDDNGHGTHVAGTIGAVANNGKGVAGVAWKVKIMPLKFLGADGGGATSDAIECIDYARKNGAHVVNASWGGPDDSYFLQRAIKNAGSAGIVFVAAAGNERMDNDKYPSYPANYRLANLVSVAATTRGDVLDPYYSNYGANSVHLAAPGTRIHSTWHTANNAYMTLDGTSMATPHVSGAVALLKANYPTESVSSTVQRLLNGTDKLSSLTGKCISGGRLNLANLFPRYWELSFQSKGQGTVTVSPNTGVHANGSAVTLSAKPAAGQVFTGWSGDITSASNPLSLVMNADKRIVANFVTASLQNDPGGPAENVLAVARNSSGRLILSIQADSEVQVESSSDLRNWTSVEIASVRQTQTGFEFELPTDSKHRFFRVAPTN